VFHYDFCYFISILFSYLELNPSIGTYLMDAYGESSKRMFLNRQLLADVCFEVVLSEHSDEQEDDEETENNDKSPKNSNKSEIKPKSTSTTTETSSSKPTKMYIYAHKAILAARCEFLGRMFQSSFIEGTTNSPIRIADIPSFAVFNAFLEYLYSDHCGLDTFPRPVSILELSNRFGSSRLISLAELYISFQIDKAVAKSMAKSEMDIIGLLLVSQQLNAKQLSQFLLHFISSNYEPMSKRSEFSLLDGENKSYIEQHRWPPLSYLEEVTKYEKLVKGTENENKCNVM
jgi:hypothetical protein